MTMTRRSRQALVQSWGAQAWRPLIHVKFDNPLLEQEARANQRALELYLASKPEAEIKEKTGVSAVHARRLGERASRLDRFTGRPYGWVVCAPTFRVDRGCGRLGPPPNTLTALFARHPTIRQRVDQAFLEGDLGRGTKVANPAVVDVHAYFKKLCKREGLTDKDYPFNCAREGYVSLCKYRRSLLKRNTLKAAMVLGGKPQQAYERGLEVRANASSAVPLHPPFDRFEADEWTTDLLVQVLEKSEAPRLAAVTRLLRARLYAMVDRGSGAVCAYRLFFHDPGAALMALLKAAILPHQRPAIRAFVYPEGPCYPSEIEGMQWMLPRVVALDRAPHQAALLADSACQTLGLRLELGAPNRPLERVGVESLYRVLTQMTRHWPNATGNHANSTFRREPERHAHRYEIGLLHDFWEAFFALYNTARMPDGSSRIEHVQHALADGSAFLLPMDDALRPMAGEMLCPAFPVHVCHTLGRAAYVQAQYGRYYPAGGQKKVLEAVSAQGMAGLRLHILEDASRAVLYRENGNAELRVCELKQIHRVWSREHRLTERMVYERLRSNGLTRSVSPTTIGGVLQELVRSGKGREGGFSNQAEAENVLAELTLLTRGAGLDFAPNDGDTDDSDSTPATETMQRNADKDVDDGFGYIDH
jgi:hypothetical protein